jgi:hypothetical protein
MKRIDWLDEKNRFISWDLIKQSYLDLYRVYKPTNHNEITERFIRKYKISKGLKENLIALVK